VTLQTGDVHHKAIKRSQFYLHTPHSSANGLIHRQQNRATNAVQLLLTYCT